MSTFTHITGAGPNKKASESENSKSESPKKMMTTSLYEEEHKVLFR
jgi:hypothetical protein